jgi:hypothetical protein
MPKRRWKIDRFEGGLNNVSDPRDVADNEVAYSSRFMVDKTGKLRTSAAGMTAMSSSPTGDEEVTGAGQLAVWHSDYLFNAGSTDNTSGSSNIAFGNSTGNTAKVDIRGGTGTWNDNAVTVNGSSAVEMNFYSADGVLRSGDATTSDCHASSRPQWTGYIQRNTFDNIDATNGPTNSDIDGDGTWVTTTTTLSPPTILLVGDKLTHTEIDNDLDREENYANGAAAAANVNGAISSTTALVVDGNSGTIVVGMTVTGTGISGRVTVATVTDQQNLVLSSAQSLSDDVALTFSVYLNGNGFNLVKISEYRSQGTWQSGDYKIASSFIYDNNQESLLYVPTSNNVFTISNDNIAFNGFVYVHGEDTGANAYSPRITGGRIYYKSDSYGSASTPWKLLMHINMVHDGVLTVSPDTAFVTQEAADYSEWTPTPAGGDDITEGGYIYYAHFGPLLDTYESLNGFSSGLQSISFDANGQGWVDSVVANRRVFLAAPTHTNMDGDAHKNHDRILYSEVGKFDTFPNINYLDIGIDDGESFTAVDSFADRILAFKQRTLYIINVASGSDTNWYLESQHSGYGVSGPPSTVRTPLGIAFVNTSGCFVFDGSKITDLTKKLTKLGTSADLDDWVTFITNNGSSYTPSIGWSNKNQQLIVMSSVTAGGSYSGNAFIYDFNTGSWTFHLDFFTDGDTYTNFINYGTGASEDMIVGQVTSSALDLKKYVPASGSVVAELQTKDIDFGDPSILKKVYAVYMTYKSSVDQLKPLEFSLDGKASFSDFATASNVAPAGNDSGDLDAQASWDVAKFTADSVQICQSIQFKLNPPDAGTFEINDISVEYRPLYKRVS